MREESVPFEEENSPSGYSAQLWASKKTQGVANVRLMRRRYSDDENKMNDAAPVPTSSEMKYIMKSRRSYLDVHSNGEMNN
ncbi:hypothetical protein TNCV_2108011 [Trichonephila clavipes]|nr:hypothetical protein TNCV_2108011 [Trichonephila clavipes]